jgi:uncharacterized phiE125 gp8 family phage protein
MRITLKTPPSQKPLTLDEVKEYCHIIGSDEDNTLNALIDTAVGIFERITSRQLCEAVYEVSLDNESSVLLSKSPVMAVVSVEANGEAIDSSLYSVVYDYEVAHVTFTQAVTAKITFKAGFLAIPDDVKGWLKARIASLYENREEGYKSYEEYIVNMYKVRYQ